MRNGNNPLPEISTVKRFAVRVPSRRWRNRAVIFYEQLLGLLF